jgi:hypothetical protein
MSTVFESGQVTCTGASSPVPLTTKQLECANFIVKAGGTVALGPSSTSLTTGGLLSEGDVWSHDNKTEQGNNRFDLQPHQVYVAGLAGVVVSWWATGAVG